MLDDCFLGVLIPVTGNVANLRFVNNKERLTAALSSKQILVGYNNYRYDDLVLAGLLSDVNPYELTKRTFEGQRISLRLNLVTLDLSKKFVRGYR